MPPDHSTNRTPPATRRHTAGGDATVYRVTVTSRVTGRRDTVDVPASSARVAYPVACAWHPTLPLAFADVEVVEAPPKAA